MEEGAAELETMCGALRQSSAIYTLAVYEEVQGRITSETPYHGSFNFRFQENTDGNYGGSSALNKLSDAVSALTAKVTELETVREVEDGDDGDPMDRIAGILSHPLVQQLTPAIMGILGVKTPRVSAPAISGAPGYEVSAALYDALCKMTIADPGTEKALIALGNLAEKDPAKFRNLLIYAKMI